MCPVLKMIQLAAVDGEQVYLMIEDHQLVHISFLDMINSLLLSGEVPGLYNLEELEPIVSSLRDLAAQEGYIGNPASFFAERVQRNLHVILVMDFTNTQFTPTCESNPALYKECCVLWLPGWSSTSMRSVPNLLLLRSGCVEEGGDLVDTVLNDGFFTIHSQVSNTLRTPRRYMAFIHTYIHIFTSKKSGIQQRCAQLQVSATPASISARLLSQAGVSKLTEARLVVDSLKSEAANQEQRLAEKQAKANSALQMITETMRSANSHKTEMECLKEQTEKENQQLVVSEISLILSCRKRAIDEELAEIEPLIREATAAVGNIKSESLSEIRSMRAPPEVIRDILEGVLRLMGILDTSWNSMKIFLAKRGVKEDIRSFDARQISRESRLAVEKLLQEKGESFDPKTARRASTAAAPLAAWVMANVQYSHVLEKISPLEQEQAKLQHNLMMAKNQIGQLSSGLSDVDRTVAKLKDQLNTYTREAAEIEIHLNRAQETINAAEGLVEKLNDEYNRWKTQSHVGLEDTGELTDLLSRGSHVGMEDTGELTDLLSRGSRVGLEDTGELTDLLSRGSHVGLEDTGELTDLLSRGSRVGMEDTGELTDLLSRQSHVGLEDTGELTDLLSRWPYVGLEDTGELTDLLSRGSHVGLEDTGELTDLLSRESHVGLEDTGELTDLLSRQSHVGLEDTGELTDLLSRGSHVGLEDLLVHLGELSKDLTALPLNSLLGAACITYLSSAPEDSRRSLLGRWQEVLGVHQFSLTSFLGSEKEQLQWLSEGLPSDELSVHNALIILKVTSCLAICPQCYHRTEVLIVPLCVVLLHAIVPLSTVLLHAIVPLSVVLLHAIVPLSVVLLHAIVPLSVVLLHAIVPLSAVLFHAIVPLSAVLLHAIVPLSAVLLHAILPLSTVLLHAIVPLSIVLLHAIVPLSTVLLHAIVPLSAVLLMLLYHPAPTNNAPCCQASLRPFLVDPSSLASDWLKRHLSGDSNVEVVSQHSQRFTTTLELAIRCTPSSLTIEVNAEARSLTSSKESSPQRMLAKDSLFGYDTVHRDRFLNCPLCIFGKVLIIQEVDTVDPILFSVLRGDFIQQGQTTHSLLFLTTRNSEPDIAPDAAATVTFVNFTTTLAGLTGQLLACAVCHERPELEKRRAELLRQEEELKLKVDQLQEVVLQELATAQGDILQNKELLSSLNEAKSSSAAIYSSLSESSRLQAELRQECDVYRPLAECSSQLFFAIRDLHKVNNMYQFSSSAFIRLFNKALSTEHKGGDASVAEHQKTLQQLVYQYEWQVLTGQAMADVKVDTSKISQSVPGWLSEERAFDVFVLKSALPELYSQLNLDDKSTWSNFSTAGDCEEHFPVQLSHKLTPFQRVLIVQALRPDRLHSSLLHFTAHILGLQDLSPPTLSLKQLMAETLSSEPVLLVISAGADPSEELRVLAHSIVGAQRYHENVAQIVSMVLTGPQNVLSTASKQNVRSLVSFYQWQNGLSPKVVRTDRQSMCWYCPQVAMGQSQAGAALELITSAAHSGEWVCLKNIHLMTAWLPSLEKELRALDLHDDFRLWLTTEAHPRFPGILAESCLKVTYEAPQGVKKNMLRTYTTWGPDLIPSATLHARALFALAWFHAVVQERRTFVPQGWAKFYEFSDADLRVSMDILAQLFRAGPARVPWEFVHGLYEGAIYGGHVDNLHDLHVIGSYLREFFNPAVLEQGSQPLGLSFHIPSSASYKVLFYLLPLSPSRDYISAIQQLSDTDKPEYFGLPANVERSLQRITSRQVISQLNALTRPVEGVAKFDREEWQLRLAPVLNLWKKLNQSSGLIQLKIPDLVESSGAKGPLPVPAFVSEEFRGALQLVQHLHKCLAAISKVIRGSHLPSGDTLLAAERIMSQQVTLIYVVVTIISKTPEQWMRKWEGPTEPLPYLRSVVSRALAVQRWNTNVSQGVLLKLSLDLADLFHPDTFLCALKQQTASSSQFVPTYWSCSREYTVPLDELGLTSSWTKNGLPAARLPVTLAGLQLEGATFNGLRLTPNTADTPSVCAAPGCTVAWMPKGDFPVYHPEEIISLPVYFTAAREHVLVNLDVPCAGNQDKWVQTGTAFFLRT
uniref:Cytoplasmic dynein 2 heavy chain 1 n=1 Tax=Timema monikensis TaxID=170555 RepID=A0A7R9EAD2_9NEOP|nr:unnamed protein product [Timema monikensis]